MRGSATAAELLALIRRTLAGAGLPSAAVTALATLAGKADHPAVRAAAAALGGAHGGVPVVEYPAVVLAAVPVPNPSDAVGGAVGTLSVAEAAALAGAASVGAADAVLVVPKRKSPAATVAVARVPLHPLEAPANPGDQP
ncbi:cobalamin biosynthesis protein [Kitasatospora sp. NPDC093806]|uniref:cobalamin biosynthesis protein n=1 Tax=Kitasatospora sp. NPDC093806 TaxID=3155075 RepID=UPI00343CE9B6